MDSETLAHAIVFKLVSHGFVAYYAGGWVRDLFMGIPSTDIDIATNASPAQIISLSRTISVGIAFGVVIVVMEGKNFEVSTFRKTLPMWMGAIPKALNFHIPAKMP